MSDDELTVGDPVTLSWYEPGEPWYPPGTIVEPAADDLVRLKVEHAAGADDAAAWLLVHWLTGNWRRWERRVDLRRDTTRERAA